MNENLPNGVPTPLPEAGAKTQEQWREYCAALLTDNERLRAEREALQAQYLDLVRRLPIPEDVKALAGKTFEELSAQADPSFSLESLIREVEQDGK